MEHKRQRHNSGFTLIELLVVVVVIAILAGLLFPVLAQMREKARQAACLSNLKQIGTAVMLYVSDYDDTYPGGGQRGGWSVWVPGPQGSWENMPVTNRQGTRNVALTTVAYLLLPYIKNTQVFLCPNDPTGDHFGNRPAQQWDGQFTRVTYEWHAGLSWGWSWPEMWDWPGGSDWPDRPLAMAEVSRPALLPMLGDTFALHIGGKTLGEQRYNECFADGHAKFSLYADPGVWPAVGPWEWDSYNPRQPVDMEKPCRPNCREEALRLGG